MSSLKTHKIHFVGIGGVGMMGIAHISHKLGYEVTGSDKSLNLNVLKLQQMGIKTQIGHEVNLVVQAEVVVTSTAINLDDNLEVAYANQKRIPIIARAEMLFELMRNKNGIAIAGTHGKTTTTSLMAAIFMHADLDPSFVIGGNFQQLNTNAHYGEGDYLIAEADESDNSFLHLRPIYSVITNIDKDHISTYMGEMQSLTTAFTTFVNLLPFYGCCVICYDNELLMNTAKDFNRKYITYGLDENADISAKNIKNHELQTSFSVHFNNELLPFEDFEVTLNLAGEHNVQNALAAITIAKVAGNVQNDKISQALENFSGVGRRFNVYKDIKLFNKTFTLIDDYAHHPEELKMTINTVKNIFSQKRLVVIFQPHRYSRTAELFDDFIIELMKPDMLILMQVYSAGETPIEQFNSKTIIKTLRQRGYDTAHMSQDLDDENEEENLEEITKNILQNNDVVLMMGAGSIGSIIRNWVEKS